MTARCFVRLSIPWVVTLVASLVLVPLARSEDAAKARAEQALAEYREYSKHRNPNVRRAAVEGLFGVDHYLVTETFLDVLDDPDPMVSRAAEIGLATQTNPESISRLVKRLWLGTKVGERLAILRAFEKSRPASAYAYALAQDLCGNKDWRLRQGAAQLIGCYPDENGKGVGTVIPLFKDAEPLVRLAALEAAGALGNPRASAEAVTLLEDDDWRVQAATIQLLEKLRSKTAIQPLIDFMKKANGRLVEDAGKSLVRLTGFEFPAEAERWQEWWDGVKDRFVLPTLEEIEKRKIQAQKAASSYARTKREYPPYHGIETRSRRMLFVLDISASMAEKITLDERNPKTIEEYKKRYGDTRVKIDIAREELINMVAGLQDYVRFNIITFNANVQQFEKNLVSASGDNKNRAIKFLAKLVPEALVPTGGGRVVSSTPGQTNTYAALCAAFDFAGGELNVTTGGQPRQKKTEADTVFLLSDGNPSTGKIVEPQMLLDWVMETNRKAKLVIHTISFGNANSALMEPLATATGGQFVRIGD